MTTRTMLSLAVVLRSSRHWSIRNERGHAAVFFLFIAVNGSCYVFLLYMEARENVTRRLFSRAHIHICIYTRTHTHTNTGKTLFEDLAVDLERRKSKETDDKNNPINKIDASSISTVAVEVTMLFSSHDPRRRVR